MTTIDRILQIFLDIENLEFQTVARHKRYPVVRNLTHVFRGVSRLEYWGGGVGKHASLFPTATFNSAVLKKLGEIGRHPIQRLFDQLCFAGFSTPTSRDTIRVSTL